MRKLYIDKNDTVAAVVEKVAELSDKDVVLYVPRSTRLTETPNNFRLLKREIDSMEKSISIESVDEEVIDMAKGVGITAKNPFFQKNKKAFSDIVSPEPKRTAGKRHVTGHRGGEDLQELPENEPMSGGSDVIEGPVSREVELDEEDVIEKMEGRKKPIHSRISRLRRKISFRLKGDDEESGRVDEGRPHRTAAHRSPAGFVIASTAAVLILIAIVLIFQNARITVALNKIPWDFTGNMQSSTLIKEPYFSNGEARVAGVILQKDKNITATYPATGTEDVVRKASGKITVYNAYSSAPQTLIRDTRFVTPDGKIFRIREGIVVPGARLLNNKLTPSSLVTTVYADKAGPDYNIPPSKFRIPGFAGTPKYEGFYAESFAPMTGGIIGTVKVATSIDIAKGKETNRKNLENAIRTELTLSIPQEIKILNGASAFTVTKEEVLPEADASGNFSVATTGTLRLFGFREADLIKALKNRLMLQSEAQLGDSGETLTLQSGVPQYSNPKVDFTNKTMTVGVTLRSIWAPAFDVDRFRSLALGKKPEDLLRSLKDAGFSAAVKSVDVSLWPFWVTRIPNNTSKVALDVK